MYCKYYHKYVKSLTDKEKQRYIRELKFKKIMQ